MGNYLLNHVHNGHLSIFLGFWSTLTNALFAYIGTELIGVTMGEAANPRKAIPKAIRRTFWRIIVLYVGSVFVIRFGNLLFEVFCKLTLRPNFDSLIVPSTNNVDALLHYLHLLADQSRYFLQTLFVANKSKAGAVASPFVVGERSDCVSSKRIITIFIKATTLVHIRILNHIINAAILVFVMSAANTDFYIGSRTLYGLALEGKAPRLFATVNRLGVPWVALVLCTCFSTLVFLNVSSSSAQGQYRVSFKFKSFDQVFFSFHLFCQFSLDIWGNCMDVHCIHTHVGRQAIFVTLSYLTYSDRL